MTTLTEQSSTPTPQTYAHSRSIPADGVLWAAMVLFGTLLGGLGILAYNGYNVGMLDLGNMAQAIGSVQRGHPLTFTYINGSTSRLAFHVELIYFLIAPFYALWSDPRLLIIIQAALFALGAIPLYRIAARRTDSRYVARIVAIIYLIYPTAQTSVLFDFHGDTLAMPLFLFALDALERRAWRSYAIWIALALSCKFYAAAAVALLGLLIWWQYRDRRAAMLTTGTAIVYGLLAFFVIRPLFTTEQTSEVHQGLSYITYYFGQVDELVATLPQRFASALVIFGPVLLVAWRGWRWLLPGLPIAVAALLSTGPGGSYDYRYHHYAMVVPFIMMATVDGIARMQAAARERPYAPRTRRRRSWRGDTGLTLGIVIIFSALLVNTPFNPLFLMGAPGYGLDPSIYGVIPRDAMKDKFLQTEVPPDAPIAASNQLAPRLTNRDTLYLLRYPHESIGPELLPQNLPQVDYALADALFDLYIPLNNGYAGGLTGDREAIGILLRDPAFGLVAQRDGLLLFERDAPAEQALHHELNLIADTGALGEQAFGTPIELVQHRIEPLGQGRLRATFTWRRTGEFTELGRFVAVSQLEGTEHARIVHLPTYALLPAWQWPDDQLVQEVFEIALPQEIQPGEYTWRTGWYNVDSPYSYATDARTLLPGSDTVALNRVTVR